MYNILSINYLENTYEISTEKIGLYTILSGNTTNQTFNIDYNGTYFNVSDDFASSSQTNDNILISLYDSSDTTTIPRSGLEDNDAYLNFYTTILDSGSTNIKTGNIPLHILNNISSDYSYKIRNLKYSEPGLAAFINYINVSPFGEIIYAENENNLLKLTAKSNNKYIDYSLLNITLYEISGSTINSSGFTFNTDNKYYDYELKPFLDNVFSPHNTPINIYNENSLCKNNYYIEELYNPINDHRYSGNTWYSIQSSLYKITPKSDYKHTLKNFKKYTYIDFGLLEKEFNIVEYDYFDSGDLKQSSVTFEINTSPYIINDSGRTMIVDVNDDYMLIEKPYNDLSSSGLTGGTGSINGIIGIYDLINVAKTADISDILLKTHMNINNDYYYKKVDSERFNIFGVYGQILSENELIQNNTTGIIYNDENNNFNFDIFNLEDKYLSYKPINIYDLGIDKKTMVPINVNSINTMTTEDNWFLTSNLSHQSDQHIIVHDTIVVGDDELYSVIEFSDELSISGINLRLSFDEVTVFELKLKENHHYNTNLYWGDSSSSTALTYYSSSSALTAHTYQPGKYILTLDGVVESLDLSDNQYITEILSWSEPDTSNLKYVSFENCNNLKSLPYESGRLKKVLAFNNTFKNTKIKNIPNGLFESVTATTFNNTFNNCIELVNIPDNLLNDAPNIKYMSHIFYNCVKLSKIPNMSGLSYIVDASYAFTNCLSLTSIDTYFNTDSNSNISFISIFENCTSLTTLPQNLFRLQLDTYSVFFNNSLKNTNITTLPTLFSISGTTHNSIFESTFMNCQKLTNISSSIFNNCNSLNFKSTFESCISLSAIPYTIFDDNINNITFESTFKNTKLKYAPSFTYNTAVTTFESTFEDSNIIIYSSNMFNTNINVASFKATFKNTNILSTPSFTYNILVTTFESTFEDTNITGIKTTLFNTNTEVLSFKATFKNTLIGKILVPIFDYNIKVTTFESTFENANLISIPNNLFNNNISVINFNATFKMNAITTISTDLFYTSASTNESALYFHSTFENNRLDNIPINIFKYMINIIDFSRTFYRNNLISIPLDVFYNNNKVELLEMTFMDNKYLNGHAPVLWDSSIYSYVQFTHDCFAITGELANHGTTIPFEWGGLCTQDPSLCTGL